jgi:hypothetical protein
VSHFTTEARQVSVVTVLGHLVKHRRKKNMEICPQIKENGGSRLRVAQKMARRSLTPFMSSVPHSTILNLGKMVTKSLFPEFYWRPLKFNYQNWQLNLNWIWK